MGLHLLTIEAAAAELGVPCKSLRTAAEAHGYLIRMGLAIRLRRAILARTFALRAGFPP